VKLFVEFFMVISRMRMLQGYTLANHLKSLLGSWSSTTMRSITFPLSLNMLNFTVVEMPFSDSLLISKVFIPFLIPICYPEFLTC